MPNRIVEKLSTPEIETLFFGYHQAYLESSRLAIIKWMIVLSTAVLVPIASAYFPELKKWGTAMVALILVVDVFLIQGWIASKLETGAKVQEQLDLELYEMPWEGSVAGERVMSETIEALASKLRNKLKRRNQFAEQQDRIRNWYPVGIEKLPLGTARLICQRSNCHWDQKLRRWYSLCLKSLAIGLIVFGFVLAMVLDWTVSDLLFSIIIPIVPAVANLQRSSVAQHSAEQSSRRIRKGIESTWQHTMQGIAPDILEVHTRYIQTDLYLRRSSIGRVPTLLYEWFWAKLEKEMRLAADNMVKEANS